ncbi:glycosyltransferase family 2 protein, partial [Klebsiella pneumoniae]|uniref:glycosyltransferase family 2 protein n=1 Tax=Klebsiella pneumoniae TaxID=573 RepID=UPI000A38B18A
SDNTLDILKEIASSDERIRIIDNAVNIGAGISRNIGLSEAEGEYIIFLDDDDYVDTNMLKHMSDFAELSGADIVVCRSRSFNLQSLQYAPMPDSIRKDLLPEKAVFSPGDIERDFFRAFIWWPWDKLFRREFISPGDIERDFFRAFIWWPWDKLFRREFIIQHSLSYQDLRTSNDLFFVCASMLSAEKVTILDEILIAHTINRKTSLSSTRSVSYHCALDALVALRDFLFKNGMMQKRQRDFYNYIVVFLEWHLNTLSGEAFNKLFQDVKLFISSFDINNEDFYDEFILSAYRRIADMSAEEYLFSLKDRVLNELEDAQRNILTLQNEVEEIKQQLQQKDEMIASMNRENLAIKADNKILENYNEELKTVQTKFLKLLSSKD